LELIRFFFVLVMVTAFTQCVGAKKSANKRKKMTPAEVAKETAAQVEQLMGRVSLPLLQSFASETDEITAIGTQANGATLVAVAHEVLNGKFRTTLELINPADSESPHAVKKDQLDGKVESVHGFSDGSWILVGAFAFYGTNEVGGVLKIDPNGEFDTKFFGSNCGGFNGSVAGLRVLNTGNILYFGDFSSYCDNEADHVAMLTPTGEFVKGYVGSNFGFADIPQSTTTLFDTNHRVESELSATEAIGSGGEQVNETDVTDLPAGSESSPSTTTTTGASISDVVNESEQNGGDVFEDPPLPVIDSVPNDSSSTGTGSTPGADGEPTDATSSGSGSTGGSSASSEVASTTLNESNSTESTPNNSTTTSSVVNESSSSSVSTTTSTMVQEVQPEDGGANSPEEQTLIDQIVATRNALRLATDSHDKGTMESEREQLKSLRKKLADLKARGSKQ